jgi:hypothetical protein
MGGWEENTETDSSYTLCLLIPFLNVLIYLDRKFRLLSACSPFEWLINYIFEKHTKYSKDLLFQTELLFDQIRPEHFLH